MAEASEAIDTPRGILFAPETAIPLGVLVLDQLTKAWVRAELTMGVPIRIVGDNVRLLYTHNEGAAFGLHVGRYSSLVFLVLAVVASVAVLALYFRTPAERRLERISLALILGGALGNIIDRVRWERVVDFIQVGVGGHYWPIFNVADSAVTVGAVLLGYAYLFRSD